MTAQTQPEAVRLRAMATQFIALCEKFGAEGFHFEPSPLDVLAVLDRIAELEAELIREAQRTANEKLRADQMAAQHHMQAAMSSEARAVLSQVFSVVNRYMPPDGLNAEQAISTIIPLLDPWPLRAAQRGGRTAPSQPQVRMDAQSGVVAVVLPEIIEKALDWIDNDTRECVRDHIAKNYDPNEIYTSLDQLERILREAPTVPQGWKLVPVEPTREMLDHVNRTVPDLFELGDEYRAMLAAAPQPPKEQADAQ